jgi:signal transduction histidine kinase
MRVKIKTKLNIAFVALLFLFSAVLVYGFPKIILASRLSAAQIIILLFLIFFFFSVIFSLLTHEFFTRPLDDLLGEVKNNWKRYHALRHNTAPQPQEIQDISKTLSLIVSDMEKTSHEIKNAKSLEALKLEFISVVSHQLRTPLTGLKWGLSLALNDPVRKADKTGNFLDLALSSVNSMIDIVNTLLQTMQLSEGGVLRKKMIIRLDEVLEKIIEKNRLFAASKDIQIHFVKPKKHIPTIMGNPGELDIVFQNILSNALLYSPYKSTITLNLSQRENLVLVRIKDEGIGIAQDEKSHIFQKFFRGKQAMKLFTDGSGLDLYVAQKIVHAHNGDMSYSNNASKKGATFSITFPIHQKGEMEGFIQY